MTSSFLDTQTQLQARLEETQRELAARERQRDELVTEKRLADQRANQFEAEAEELREEIQVRQRRIDEMSRVVEKTIALQEKLDVHRDESIESRVRAERAEKLSTDTAAKLEAVKIQRNDLRQVNNDLNAEIEQARRIVEANRARVAAQALLDQVTA